MILLNTAGSGRANRGFPPMVFFMGVLRCVLGSIKTGNSEMGREFRILTFTGAE